MSFTPKVIGTVVNNDLCTGCGLCVYQCPTQSIEMHWNQYGFIIPRINGICDSKGECISVCPFNPYPEKEVATENELGDLFLKETNQHHHKIGRYNNIYVGYAEEFRLISSSGGIATYIFNELLQRGIVDHIFSVKKSTKPGVHYEYAVSSNKQDLLNASKTRYFPVSLASVIFKISELEGKVAIAGVACFIKAIRLAQYKEPFLQEKIPFLLGIICGGIKSRFFTEYLAGKLDVAAENIENPQFRIKDSNSTAGDYSFGCTNKMDKQERTIRMMEVGDMWGSGLFKANACDFCDDVTTELADISLGDAWLPPYNADGRGTSVIVTRSTMADSLIQGGLKEEKLTVEELPLIRFLASQQGSFNHRHKGLNYRIKKARKRGQLVPPKRFEKENISIDFKWVQKQRMRTRRKGFKIWEKEPNTETFDSLMIPLLTRLKKSTLLYHYRRALIKKIFRK